MKKLLLFATAVLLATSTIEVVANESANAVQSTVESYQTALRMVYSNCYDGYLNVRSQPTSKSQIVGRLNNGPEGAELLGVEGTWSRVRVGGVVGYVASKYLQSTATDPVYIKASAVVGEWVWTNIRSGCIYTIKSNGTFTTSGYGDYATAKSGTWYLSYHNLVLKFSNGKKVVCSFEQNGLLIEDWVYMKE